MSIDARVFNVFRNHRGERVLELMDRAPGAVAGRNRLTVTTDRHESPPLGTTLWGNDSAILTGSTTVYERVMGGMVQEVSDSAPAWKPEPPRGREAQR